jgi:Uma2 family endonuclease
MAMALQMARWRFTVDEYHRMAKAGILHEDDRVELIEGEIVEIPPIGPGHASSVDELNLVFVEALGRTAVVRVQNPVRLDKHNEPEPDIAIVRRRPGGYQRGHPEPSDILLIVEVGATSVALDRRVKLPLYARCGVPEVWLVDLRRGTIRVYRDPSPTGYRTARTVRRGERLAPLAFPDCALAVADILGAE